MKLRDVIATLDDFDEDETIYAADPWTGDSDALVMQEPEGGGVPDAAQRQGMTYLIEVSIAKEFLEGWAANQERRPTREDLCRRLIDYAVDDA